MRRVPCPLYSLLYSSALKKKRLNGNIHTGTGGRQSTQKQVGFLWERASNGQLAIWRINRSVNRTKHKWKPRVFGRGLDKPRGTRACTISPCAGLLCTAFAPISTNFDWLYVIARSPPRSMSAGGYFAALWAISKEAKNKKRQQEVNEQYHKRAGELDLEQKKKGSNRK